VKENPGPGEYVVVGNLVQPLQVKMDSSHGLSSVSFSKSMPSMPPTRDPKLMRYSGKEHDKIGPGDYEGTIPRSMCTKRINQTANFHASPSQRKLFQHTASIDNRMPHPDEPAPGTYITEGKLERGASAPFLSKTPQAPPMGSNQETPAPGEYYDGLQDPKFAAVSAEDKQLAFASNRSQSQRSESWQLLANPFTHPEYIYKVPGPGTYPNRPGFNCGKTRRARSQTDVIDPRNNKYHAVHQPQQMVALRDSDGLKLCGFESCDEKSSNKPNKECLTTSCAYNLEDSMGQSIMSGKNRESLKVGKKGVFGSQAHRFHGFPLDPPPGICPGPGEHQDLSKRDGYYELKGVQTRTSFNSRLHRLPVDPLADRTWEKPSPGSYEAFDKVNYRNKFRRAKTDHLSFGSSASRWNPGETFVGQKFEANPGPGNYDPAEAIGNVLGGAKTSSQRSEVKHAGLGPGIYNTHGSTMHKMTYNVSGPDAAARAQAGGRSLMEPPNVGGGAGGGISATKARLGLSAGGAGANQVAADDKVWAEDSRLRTVRAEAVSRSMSQKGWAAITDGPSSPDSTGNISGTTPGVPAKSALKSSQSFEVTAAVPAAWLAPAQAPAEVPAAAEAPAPQPESAPEAPKAPAPAAGDASEAPVSAPAADETTPEAAGGAGA
jgi:hypothetical protein